MTTDRRRFLQAAAGLSLAPWAAHAAALSKICFVHSSPVARPYHAYTFAGARAGLYEKIGLDPEFLFISGSAATLQLLISGDADIGNIGILEFIASKKKQPTLPLSVVYCHDYRGVVCDGRARGQPDKSVADLKGKSVGVLSLAAGTVPTLKAMAREAGIDPALHQFVAVGADAAGDGRAEIRPHRCVFAFHWRDCRPGKLGHEVSQLLAGCVVRRVSSPATRFSPRTAISSCAACKASRSARALPSSIRSRRRATTTPCSSHRPAILPGAAQRRPRDREDAFYLQAARRRPSLGRNDRGRAGTS